MGLPFGLVLARALLLPSNRGFTMQHAVGELAADVGYQPRRHGAGLAQDFQVCGRDAWAGT